MCIQVVKDAAGLVIHLHCLLFASSAVLPQRIETKERGRTGKAALPISDNTHSVSITHKHNSQYNALKWTIYHTCSHCPIKTKTRKRVKLLQSIRYSSAVQDVKYYESRPTENHKGYRCRHTKNGLALIKSLVNSIKYVN